MREFFSLDNPKNAETNDDDDQPGADESDSQVTNSDTVEFEKNWLLVSYISQGLVVNSASTLHFNVFLVQLIILLIPF